MELRINRVRINRSRPVIETVFFTDDGTSHVEVTTEDTSTGDYQTTIMDEPTTITGVTDPERKYALELPGVPKNEAKTREYSHQGSLDYHDGLLG